jgi:carboxyl-terminal processing protease
MQVKRRHVEKHLVGVGFLALIIFSAGVFGLASRPAEVGPVELEPGRSGAAATEKVDAAEVTIVEPSAAQSPELEIVDRACELICRGEFGAAGRVIESAEIQDNARLGRLLKIVRRYEVIEQRRQAEREAAYQRQLAEVEKLGTATDSNDSNDVNDVTKVLSVIAQACEFASEEQREALLSTPFVQGVFEKAKSRAAELESRNKWLDAYMTCYSWLQAIMPEDQEYSDYAEQLLEKASIVASLRDSPCEMCQERYEKVEEKMFRQAIDALHFNYVNIVDYRQMASKAVRRCEFLAEVMGSLEQNAEDSSSSSENKSSPESVKGFRHPQRLAAWSTGLAAVLDEVNESATGFTKDKFIAVFQKVLALNSATTELPQPVLTAHFAEAALSALDPYTVMVWPRQAPDFEKTMTNEFTGIGVEITKQKGLLTVASLLPDTPAYNSGLDAGDVIEAVDGLQTKDMSLGCAVRKITGPAGTEVTLTIGRAGEEKSKDISITRAKITVPTIRGWQRTDTGKWLYMVDEKNKIGYIRITSFSSVTASDLEDALNELEAAGLKGLILDLRFDTGGLLDSAVEVTDKFIEEGLIVRTRSRLVPTFASAHKENTHPNYPLVVLVNRVSASASEIVAGALQDKAHKRAVLVGERTQGKGSVQGITPYPGGGAQLKYTMAYYHLPSGQRVESQEAMKKQGRKDWGLSADIELQLRSDELRNILDVQRDNDVLVQANSEERHASLKKRTLEETLAADPQLEVGILVVTSKLVEDEVRRLGGATEAL